MGMATKLTATKTNVGNEDDNNHEDDDNHEDDHNHVYDDNHEDHPTSNHEDW